MIRKIETIDAIHDWGLGYSLGSAVDLIARSSAASAGHLDELKQARWFLDHEIVRLMRLAAEAKAAIAPSTTTIKLADGTVIALGDWVDDKLYGTAGRDELYRSVRRRKTKRKTTTAKAKKPAAKRKRSARDLHRDDPRARRDLYRYDRSRRDRAVRRKKTTKRKRGSR